MAHKSSGVQLCPTCKIGQETYLLDERNPFCPYLSCHNGTSCAKYIPIEKNDKNFKEDFLR